MHYQDPVFSHVLKIGVTHKCLHYSLLGGVGDRVRRGFVFFFFLRKLTGNSYGTPDVPQGTQFVKQ